MKWFGKPRGTQLEKDTEHVETPVGRACAWCEATIDYPDYGVMVYHVHANSAAYRPIHMECHIRTIVGGLNHLKGRCTCCGGSAPPDPPEMRPRQAAIAATAYWLSKIDEHE